MLQDSYNYFPHFNNGKLRPSTEDKELTQVHIGIKWQSQDLNPGTLAITLYNTSENAIMTLFIWLKSHSGSLANIKGNMKKKLAKVAMETYKKRMTNLECFTLLFVYPQISKWFIQYEIFSLKYFNRQKYVYVFPISVFTKGCDLHWSLINPNVSVS